MHRTYLSTILFTVRFRHLFRLRRPNELQFGIGRFDPRDRGLILRINHSQLTGGQEDVQHALAVAIRKHHPLDPNPIAIGRQFDIVLEGVLVNLDGHTIGA